MFAPASIRAVIAGTGDNRCSPVCKFESAKKLKIETQPITVKKVTSQTAKPFRRRFSHLPDRTGPNFDSTPHDIHACFLFWLPQITRQRPKSSGSAAGSPGRRGTDRFQGTSTWIARKDGIPPSRRDCRGDGIASPSPAPQRRLG